MVPNLLSGSIPPFEPSALTDVPGDFVLEDIPDALGRLVYELLVEAIEGIGGRLRFHVMGRGWNGCVESVGLACRAFDAFFGVRLRDTSAFLRQTIRGSLFPHLNPNRSLLCSPSLPHTHNESPSTIRLTVR